MEKWQKISKSAYRKTLSEKLESAGAVLVEGTKACGKTVLVEQVSGSKVMLDMDEAAWQVLAVNPGVVLGEEVPRLIDEWQVVPANNP